MGILAAVAVLDLTPRAAAGYLTVAAPAASTTLGIDSGPCDSPSPSPVAHRLGQKFGLPAAAPQQSGGMSTTGTGNTGGDSPISGVILHRELSAESRPVYYREPINSLALSRFIDSILDPPRGL